MIFTGRPLTQRQTEPTRPVVAHSRSFWDDPEFGGRVHVASSGAYLPGRIGGAA